MIFVVYLRLHTHLTIAGRTNSSKSLTHINLVTKDTVQYSPPILNNGHILDGVIVDHKIALYRHYSTKSNPESFFHLRGQDGTLLREVHIFTDLAYQIHEGTIYILIENEILAYSIADCSIESISNQIGGEFKKNKFRKINVIGGDIWISSGKGMFRIRKSKPFFRKALDGGNIGTRDITLSGENEILVCSEEGITRMNLTTRTFKPTPIKGNRYSLTSLDTSIYMFNTFAENIEIWEDSPPYKIENRHPKSASGPISNSIRYI